MKKNALKPHTKATGRPKGVMPIDTHVGRMIRTRRMFLNLSQEELAKKIGLTFQQIQKYEYGINRISSNRLYYIAKTLKVSVNYFFQNIQFECDLKNFEKEPIIILQDSHSSKKETRETIDLIKSFKNIKNSELRRTIINLCKLSLEQECKDYNHASQSPAKVLLNTEQPI